MVRVVQQARRAAGLDVSDRVRVSVDGSDEVTDAVRAHEHFVAGEVLAEAVDYAPVPDGFAATVGDGAEVRVSVART